MVQAAKGAEVEFRGAFGLAQRRYKLENRFFTLFNLGSARHFFAQLALARLLEQGRLAKQVLGPWSGEPVWEEKLAELVPGRRPWDVVAEEVLRPAGLSQTAYYYLDQLPAAAAAGYTTTNGGELVENIYAILREGLKPQLFSTAHDLRRLWHALAEGGIISPETARALLSLTGYRETGLYQIEGTAPGAQVFLAGSLEEARSVIVLSNGEEGVRAVFEQLITLSGAGR